MGLSGLSTASNRKLRKIKELLHRIGLGLPIRQDTIAGKVPDWMSSYSTILSWTLWCLCGVTEVGLLNELKHRRRRGRNLKTFLRCFESGDDDDTAITTYDQ